MGETERESAAVATDDVPSLDLVFALLANRQRRYALYYLYTRSDGVATLDELANGVLALEARSGDRAADRSRIETSLRHAHLPKLEDAGVIEHDVRSRTVRYWDYPWIEEWLEHAYYTEMSSGTRAAFEQE